MTHDSCIMLWFAVNHFHIECSKNIFVKYPWDLLLNVQNLTNKTDVSADSDLITQFAAQCPWSLDTAGQVDNTNIQDPTLDSQRRCEMKSYSYHGAAQTCHRCNPNFRQRQYEV